MFNPSTIQSLVIIRDQTRLHVITHSTARATRREIPYARNKQWRQVAAMRCYRSSVGLGHANQSSRLEHIYPDKDSGGPVAITPTGRTIPCQKSPGLVWLKVLRLHRII